MKLTILGVSIDNVTFEEAINRVRGFLLSGRSKVVVTPNPEFVIYAGKDEQFRHIINNSDLAVPDGVGLIWAGRILGRPIKERVAGADLAEKAIELSTELGKSVFFLGGGGSSGQRAATMMRIKYPGLRVVGTWPGQADREGDAATLEKIRPLKVDLLLIAYGHPKQEYWIDRNLGKINVRVAMGVGGSFDFWSGDVKRAPTWVRGLGAEWLFRLIRQPWRIRRQSSLLKFIYLILKEKWRK